MGVPAEPGEWDTVLAFLQEARISDVLLPGWVDRGGRSAVLRPLASTVYLESDGGYLQLSAVNNCGGLRFRVVEEIEYESYLTEDPDEDLVAASVGTHCLGSRTDVPCVRRRNDEVVQLFDQAISARESKAERKMRDALAERGKAGAALDGSYGYLRQFTPQVLAAVEFAGGTAAADPTNVCRRRQAFAKVRHRQITVGVTSPNVSASASSRTSGRKLTSAATQFDAGGGWRGRRAAGAAAGPSCRAAASRFSWTPWAEGVRFVVDLLVCA